MAGAFSNGDHPAGESAAPEAKILSAKPAIRTPAITIDVRALSATNRNAKIFEAFDGLVGGGVLELKEEADPRSLRNEFAQYRPGKFSWDARNLGFARWTISLERIDERSDMAA